MLSSARPRLEPATLHLASADAVPSYDRRPSPRIAHIGVGAFARAHLGVYADELLRGGWPATIRGVSLRRPDAEERLAPQGGLYSVEVQLPAGTGSLQVIGSLTSVGTGPAAAEDAVADPHVSLVTLTITEKGYDVGADEMGGDESRPSAAGIVAAGLARRRRTGTPPPVVAPLDNLPANGAAFRAAVISAAGRLGVGIERWIEDHVVFANSVVDRMVPAPTEEVLERIAGRLRLDDRAAVTTEAHRSWVISCAGELPPLNEVGVEVVADTSPFERRKLWLLNGPHSVLAYCGMLAGCRTISEAVDHPVVGSFLRLVTEDVLDVCDLADSLHARRFVLDSLDRFSNPGLGHTCAQVGEDGSRKLPQRLLPVVAARRQRNLPTRRFATVVAIWIGAVTGIPLAGVALPAIADPAGESLRAAGRHSRHRLIDVAIGGRASDGFVEEVAGELRELERSGLLALVGDH